jgi:hypothetical protein
MPGGKRGVFRTSAIRMSAGAAIVALGLWQAATPASAIASPAKPEWIITQTAVGLLGGARAACDKRAAHRRVRRGTNRRQWLLAEHFPQRTILPQVRHTAARSSGPPATNARQR